MPTILKRTVYYEGTVQALRYYVQEVKSDPTRKLISPEMLRIVRIRSGRCTWVISGKAYKVGEDDIILLNNTEQRVQTEISPDNPVLQEVICFTPIAFGDCTDCLPVFFRRTEIFSNVFSGNYPQRARILPILDLMRLEAEEDMSRCDINLLSMMRILLVLVSRAAEEMGMTEQSRHSFSGSARNYQMICDTINYIKANIGEDLSAEICAGRAGLSRYYFSRIFKSLMGMTFPQYVRVLRLSNVQKLTAEKNYNTLDAVYASGFGSISAYYKALHCIIGDENNSHIKDM